MKRYVETQAEADLMNKILLQKLMADTFLKIQINSRSMADNTEVQPFEEYSQKYFNLDAFNVTHAYFNIEKVLSIHNDYYQDLVKKIEVYGKLTNIIKFTRLHPDYDVYDWSISYKTLEFFKQDGFNTVFEQEQQKVNKKKIKEETELEKLLLESKLMKWNIIIFWPLTLVSLAIAILSLLKN